jgi:tetratricopeptide (TPR) repeat protein
VLEHNRLDLLSLAGLMSYLMRLVDAGPGLARHALEALALGRTYERASLDERAERAYEHALVLSGQGVPGRRPLPRPLQDEIQVEALQALAIAARRQRRYEAAAGRWQQLLDLPRCPRDAARDAMQALAIHHEHRVRDLAAAKLFALKSLDEGSDAAWGDAVRHRLKRIERKISERRAPLFPSSLPAQPSCGSQTSARRTSS